MSLTSTISILAAWLWQGVALVWLTALGLRCLPRLSAAARHRIWWLVLGLVMVLPIWNVRAELTGPVAPTHQRRTAPRDGVSTLETRVAASAPTRHTIQVPAPPRWALVGAALVWISWLVWGVARLVLALATLRRLTRRSWPVGESVQAALPMWSVVRHVGRRPELFQSLDFSGACAVGLLGRPRIIVSTKLVSTLEPADLDRIVLHEEAHVARYDDWSRLLQAIIVSVAGPHPAVALIGRHIDFEREAACDDRVVARVGTPLAYARCLATAADIATSAPQGRVGALVLGATDGGRMFLRRVVRLTAREPRATSRGARLISAAGALAALATVGAAASGAPRLVVQPQRVETAPIERAGSVEMPSNDPLASVVATAAQDEGGQPLVPRTARWNATSSSRRSIASVEAIVPVQPNRAQLEERAEPLIAQVPEASSGFAPTVQQAPPHEIVLPPLPSHAVWSLAPQAGSAAPVDDSSGRTWSRVGDRGAASARSLAQAGMKTGRGAKQFGQKVGQFFTGALR